MEVETFDGRLLIVRFVTGSLVGTSKDGSMGFVFGKASLRADDLPLNFLENVCHSGSSNLSVTRPSGFNRIMCGEVGFHRQSALTQRGW